MTKTSLAGTTPVPHARYYALQSPDVTRAESSAFQNQKLLKPHFNCEQALQPMRALNLIG